MRKSRSEISDGGIRRDWRGKRIGVMVESDACLYSIEPLLEELRKNSIDLVVFTLDWEGNTEGYQEMFEGVRAMLRNKGFEPTTLAEHIGEEFDLYLAPYIHGDEPIKAKCNMRYSYGPFAMKPRLTYKPEMMQSADVFLCTNVLDAEILKAYGATYLVDNLKFHGVNKYERRGQKKRVLFAPTYNDEFKPEELAQVVKELKKEFYVVVKEHHGTSYLKKNDDKRNSLEESADEYYHSSDINIAELIMKVDVCLFGNSAAIGEAMYAGVPCAILTRELDSFRLGDLCSTSYDLVQKGILPYVGSIDDVCKYLNIALSKKYRDKQLEYAKRMFPQGSKTGVTGYVEVIDYYLRNELAHRYCDLHHYVINDGRERLEEKDQQIYDLQQQLLDSRQKCVDLEEVMNGGLHRLASKVYEWSRKK